MAHRSEFFRPARLQRERVLRFPIPVVPPFVHIPSAPAFNEPKCTRGIALFYCRLEAKRFQKRISESNICQPGFFQVDAQRQMIEFGSFAAIVPGDARREECDLKSQNTQQRCKCGVQLVAKPSPSTIDYLLQHRIFVHDNFVFERNVQILERDHEQVRVVERSKSFGRGFKRAGIGNASEIRLHIEHGSNQE